MERKKLYKGSNVHPVHNVDSDKKWGKTSLTAPFIEISLEPQLQIWVKLETILDNGPWE